MNPPPNPDPSHSDWSCQPAVQAFIQRVLDHRDLRGRFPKTLTYRASDPELEVLDRYLPEAALRKKSQGRLVVLLEKVEHELNREALDHGREPEPLEALFDRIAGRRPRNLKHEESARRSAALDALVQGISLGIERAGNSAVGFEDKLARAAFNDQIADAETGRSRWLGLAREAGLSHVRQSAARLAHSVLLVRSHRQHTLRLDHLSIKVAGDTKAYRPNSSDYLRLTETLLEITPDLAEELVREAGPSKPMLKRLLLEHYGILTNDTPVDVLVRGPLALCLDGERFDYIERLAQKGIATKLGLQLIRNPERLHTDAARILTVENETAFHLLADRHPEDLVLFAQGQPSLAVTRTLRRLSLDNQGLVFAHSGDLDRAGFLIYRTLRRRTGLEILPHQMDVATFEAHRRYSKRMTDDEVLLTHKLSSTWEEPHGRDTLAHLAEAGLWLEQEALLIS